ncbi:uncharacterized protein VTP21DRAFT_10358 [Calcarisporiella thermophila]|uniref:uncharacterized protein n=1 Tax=Calcarisporiella thermophila TaxID=911321 RepID=UPI0037433137
MDDHHLYDDPNAAFETAPESTRGLFDAPEMTTVIEYHQQPSETGGKSGSKSRNSTSGGSKRRSVNFPLQKENAEGSQQPQQQQQQASLAKQPSSRQRGHQRSRSAAGSDAASAGQRAGLQPVAEEPESAGSRDATKKSKRQSRVGSRASPPAGGQNAAASGDAAEKSEALESLHSIISTLKTLPTGSVPPVKVVAKPNGMEAQAGAYPPATKERGHRKHLSMSAMPNKNGEDSMASDHAPQAPEVNTGSSGSAGRSRRSAFMTKDGLSSLKELAKLGEDEDEADEETKRNAIAEAEAKLSGMTPTSVEDYSSGYHQGRYHRSSEAGGSGSNGPYLHGGVMDFYQQHPGDRRSNYDQRRSMHAPQNQGYDQQQYYPQQAPLHHQQGQPQRTRGARRYTTSMAPIGMNMGTGGQVRPDPAGMQMQPRPGGNRMSFQLPPLAEMDAMLGARVGKRFSLQPIQVPPMMGHQRQSSRGYDNSWRASMGEPYSPRMSQYGGYGEPFSPRMSGFFGGGGQNQMQGGRRPLFIAHLPFSAVTPLLKSKQLIRGVLRINKRNRSDAYVISEDLDSDIYICGSRDRNRALEGDVVAVRLVDVDKVLREKKEKEDAKVMKLGGRHPKEFRKRTEEDEEPEVLADDVDIEKVRPQFCGVIVAVLDRPQGQIYSGTLGLSRPNTQREEKKNEQNGESEGSKAEEGADSTQQQQQQQPQKKDTSSPRIVWFRPSDKRVPLIAIPIDQAPEGFVENHSAYAKKLFLGTIKRWPITSLHPFGTLERQIGEIGSLSVETEALLADHNVSNAPFSETVMACLPTVPWRVPDGEMKERRDLRAMVAFTVDAPSDNDLVDAVSVKKTTDGNYEIAIHVADVAYFVRPHSAVDKEARSRAVGTQLVQQLVPMLPELLAEDLCSLKPGIDRMAVSVICKMTADAKLIDTTMARSVVRSCARLDFEQVQSVIDGKPLAAEVHGVEKSDVEDSIRTLNEIAKKLRSDRVQNGAMTLELPQIEFMFNDAGRPVDITVREQMESERMMEELMLLANSSVAQKISSHLPDQALLCRQPEPLARKMNEFRAICEQAGYPIEGSSARAVMRAITRADAGPEERRVLQTLAEKLVESPRYFCTGAVDISKYQHYELNVPLHTQFTNPVRRYSDLLVHRQLEAALAGEKRFYLDKEAISKTAEQCNAREEMARHALRASHHLHLCAYLSREPITCDALVMAVEAEAFDVLVPRYGVEKRVHLDQMPLERSVYADGALKLSWQAGVDTLERARREMEERRNREKGVEVLEEEEDEEEESSEGEDGEIVELGTEASKSGLKSTGAEAAKKEDRVVADDDGKEMPNSQVLRVFSSLRVVLTVEDTKYPPVVRLTVVNPYV